MYRKFICQIIISRIKRLPLTLKVWSIPFLFHILIFPSQSFYLFGQHWNCVLERFNVTLWNLIYFRRARGIKFSSYAFFSTITAACTSSFNDFGSFWIIMGLRLGLNPFFAIFIIKLTSIFSSLALSNILSIYIYYWIVSLTCWCH